MTSKFYVTMTIALLTTTKAANIPQTETFTPDSAPQETQYKEVIMYLTPSQIRAYEQSQKNQQSHENSLIRMNNRNFGEEQLDQQKHEADIQAQNWREAENLHFQQINHNDQYFKRPVIDQPNKNQTLQLVYTPSSKNQYQQLTPQLELTSGQNNQHKPQTSEQQSSGKEQEPLSTTNFNIELLHNHLEKLKMDEQRNSQNQQRQLFYPDNEYLEQIALHIQQHQTRQEIGNDPAQQRYHLIPYEYSNNQQIHENLAKEILNEINPHLLPQTQDETQYQRTGPNHEWPSDGHQNQFEQQNYAPNYIDQNIRYNIEGLLKQIHLEKLEAQARAEAIAKSPPVVVHRDISIVRRVPTHIIKTINVPVPAPFLLPVPELYGVKVPQPYPVPVEIIRPFAVPIVKTEKIEVEKPVPVEVEKHVPVTVEKKVFVPVDKPYTVERIVPVPVRKEVPVEVPVYRPERLTIVRHVWSH